MLTEKLESKINNALLQLHSPGLLKGDMGVCIYFFVMGRIKSDPSLTKKAERVLKMILAQISNYKKLCVEDGIIGVALGITFLYRQKFIVGNVNEILADIDSYVYKSVGIVQEKDAHHEHLSPVLDSLMYFVVRYEDETDKKRKKFFREILVYLFNFIYIHRPDDFYQETFPFSLKKEAYLFIVVLVKLYKLGIERDRISKIFKEMQPFLFSNIPMLRANRFFLVTVVRLVGMCLKDSDWLDFANQQMQQINLVHILQEEFADKSILPLSGVIGVWLLKEANCQMGFHENLEFEKYDIKTRILGSSLWNRIEIDGEFFSNCYSLDGYCGIKLFLEYIGYGGFRKA